MTEQSAMTNPVPGARLGRGPGEEALLVDGSTVRIRPLVPADRPQVLALHADRMSEASRRLRFLGTSRRAPLLAADRLCGPPRSELYALGAWSAGVLVGEADFETSAERPETAELAVAVADAWHHRGVGSLLLEYLVHAAREHGVTAFEADALAGNGAVHRLFSDLGLPVHRRYREGEVRVVVPLAGANADEHYLRAVEERGRTADLASLTALLRPRSVAVLGASRRSGSVGQSVLRKIRDGGFRGELWAVNPHAERVADMPSCPSLEALPRIPELAVLAVPAAAVPAAAEECGRVGVRALVVLTSGLDADQARQLLHCCRAHSMRLVGPNSLGIAQTDPGVRLDAEFGGAFPKPGTAGVAVQSGGVGIALLERLAWLGIGVSTFVSLGDKYDVSANDLLQWWESDGRTDLALLHLESFGNPRAFARTARRVTRRFPVLTVDAGRSSAGRRGAAAHTAAVGVPAVTRAALFDQAGITATRSIAELVEIAALLHAQPLPAERGAVVVVSNAAGIGVLTADACAEAGLSLPSLPADLAARLRRALPDGAGTGNPVDITPAAGPDHLLRCLDLLERSDVVDALVVCLVPTALTTDSGRDPLRALLDGKGRRRQPVAVVRIDQQAPVSYLTAVDGALLPAYADSRSAASALAAARARARALARPAAAEAELPGCDPAAAQRLVDGFLAERPEGGLLDPARTVDLLEYYRLPVTTTIWAPDEHTAVLAARSVRLLRSDGRAVVAAHRPGKPSEDVCRTVRTDREARDAFRELTAAPDGRTAGAVVRPAAAPGVDLRVEIRQDEVFGPLVVLGPADELRDGLVARLAPLTEADPHAMVADSPAAPLLADVADLTALYRVLVSASRMAADLPQLTEARLDPVVVRSDGVLCTGARIRVEPRRPFDPYLRRLRRRPVAEEER
ncbi:GNAT family N-acetyltransferase [Kitasatospora sp. NPDC059646]|uniref:bifunctional acetate--CoA ligase family protein/GNAT family N-acetyltransferase n=1 Tax=Kitasatospora sp. NPDC059646 TaxID=3346893 RepID=UPI0036BF65EA